MKRLFTRIRCFFEAPFIRLKASDYDYVRFHLGTNSLALTLIFVIVSYVALRSDVFDWSYLKGTEPKLAFFIGLFSIVFGMIFYKYWGLGNDSIYSMHFAKTRFLPNTITVLFRYRDFTFGIGKYLGIPADELTSVTRKLISIAIFFSLALITFDNTGYDKLENVPNAVTKTHSSYCPVEEDVEEPPPVSGCELIIRAFELGYADDLGVCEPEEIDPKKMQVCEKRRADEPYLHYTSRVVTSSLNSLAGLLNQDAVDRVRDKFELQLRNIKDLRDYQSYAMSASPRASHHIWTNLPYPENSFVRQYREVLQPNYCIGQFQNQTNTVQIASDDARKDSKLMEHVYGQLLFNPRSDITVAYCKEFKIHWDAAPDTCERLANNPEDVLQESDALEPVSLVLRRHDIANSILSLQAAINEIDALAEKSVEVVETMTAKTERDEPTPSAESGSENTLAQASDPGADIGSALTAEISATINSAITGDADLTAVPAQSTEKRDKGKIVVAKIAKDKQQIRDKSDLVSFQCFIQSERDDSYVAEHEFNFKSTPFTVRTRYFPKLEGKGESQIAMYNELSKLLEDSFHYSQYSSRSDMDIQGTREELGPNSKTLEDPKYLFSRLEMLKNVDIFLDNNWVFERDDLLGVYPYHVHLQNYVGSFRAAYRENRGRL